MSSTPSYLACRKEAGDRLRVGGGKDLALRPDCHPSHRVVQRWRDGRKVVHRADFISAVHRERRLENRAPCGREATGKQNARILWSATRSQGTTLNHRRKRRTNDIVGLSHRCIVVGGHRLSQRVDINAGSLGHRSQALVLSHQTL